MKQPLNIMASAWKLARRGARKYGGEARQYIACAMRIVWHESRRVVHRVVGWVGGYMSKAHDYFSEWLGTLEERVKAFVYKELSEEERKRIMVKVRGIVGEKVS